MSEFLTGVGFAVLAAVGLTVQSLAVRLGSKTDSISSIIAGMFAVNLLVMVPTAVVVAYPDYRVSLFAVLSFVAAGILGSFVARFAYFIGIARLGSSRTEPLKALFPAVSVGMGVLVLGEDVTVPLLAGVALVLGGGIAVVAESRTSPVTATGEGLRRQLAFPLLAALLLGIDPIFTKLGLSTGTPPIVGVTIRIAAGAAGFALYLVLRGDADTIRQSATMGRWLVVASLANTVYLLAYYAALARTPVTVATPILGLSTLLVVAGAAVFLQDDERVTWQLIAAALVVVVGITLVARG